MLIKEKHITRMGVGPLCKLFGKTRQAFYNRKNYYSAKEQEEIILVELVAQVRRELPGLDGHKLYKCIYQPLSSNEIKMGRDKLFTLLRGNCSKVIFPRGLRKNIFFCTCRRIFDPCAFHLSLFSFSMGSMSNNGIILSSEKSNSPCRFICLQVWVEVWAIAFIISSFWAIVLQLHSCSESNKRL